MKFSISCGEILGRLQTMGKVIEDKNAIPVLTNFLFSVRADKLILTAANSEMRMTSTLDISNIEGTDSDVCIPGGKLTDYIKLLPEQPITFSVPEGSQIPEITSQSGKSVQTCVSANDYPAEQPVAGDVRSVSMNEQTLLAGISTTIFATGNDDLRPIMNGIFFDIEPDKVTFVATDSHKMVRFIRTDVTTNDITAGFTLNKKPANLLRGILSKSEQPVYITFGDKNVAFETLSYKFVCRLAEGNYPQYRSVIPTNNAYRVIVNREDFIKAIARTSIFVDGSRLVRCELSANTIKISTQDLDYSCSANETIPCDFDGQDMSIGFSSQYLVEVLNNIDSAEVVLNLSDPSRPGLVNPTVNKDNEDLIIIIMPMQV